MNLRNFLFRTVGLMAAACTTSHVMAAETPATISAADPRIRYEGRFDFSDSNAPVIIWQASRIQFDFNGDTVGLNFTNAHGQNFFDVSVDGSNTVVDASQDVTSDTVSLSGLGPGRHFLSVFKRSEANAGTVAFRGVTLSPAAQLWSPPAPVYHFKMEFIGDSITVGACNEDGPADQWQNRRTHNAAKSWAADTAAAFNADHRNIAISGMGICTGWVTIRAGEAWDRIYPDPASPREPAGQWMPQVVFVNFGENDDSFTRAHGKPFPPDFTTNYIALIRDVRRAYPTAEIVLLRGGMTGGAMSEPLRLAWEAAAKELEADDPRVHHYAFTHWTATHPRVADDQAMADELVTWIKQQKFMADWK